MADKVSLQVTVSAKRVAVVGAELEVGGEERAGMVASASVKKRGASFMHIFFLGHIFHQQLRMNHPINQQGNLFEENPVVSGSRLFTLHKRGIRYVIHSLGMTSLSPRFLSINRLKGGSNAK